MPRDSDKDNDSRGRRDRPPAARVRSRASGKPRALRRNSPSAALRARATAARPVATAKPSASRRQAATSVPPPRGGRCPAPRFQRPSASSSATTVAARSAASAASSRVATARSPIACARDGEKRPFKPRGDRPYYGDRDDRPSRSRDRDDRRGARPAARFGDKKFGDKRPYTPRDRDGEKRPTRRAARARRVATARGRTSKFDGERKFSRGAPERKFDARPRGYRSGAPDRGPRKDFARSRRSAAIQSRGRSATRVRAAIVRRARISQAALRPAARRSRRRRRPRLSRAARGSSRSATSARRSSARRPAIPRSTQVRSPARRPSEI